MFKTRYMITTKGNRTVIRRDPKSPTYPLVEFRYSRLDDEEGSSTEDKKARPTRRRKKKRR